MNTNSLTQPKHIAHSKHITAEQLLELMQSELWRSGLSTLELKLIYARDNPHFGWLRAADQPDFWRSTACRLIISGRAELHEVHQMKYGQTYGDNRVVGLTFKYAELNITADGAKWIHWGDVTNWTAGVAPYWAEGYAKCWAREKGVYQHFWQKL